MELCQHPILQFASGDYYIWCQKCLAHWVHRGEKGDESGYRVGEHNQLIDDTRVRLKDNFDVIKAVESENIQHGR